MHLTFRTQSAKHVAQILKTLDPTTTIILICHDLGALLLLFTYNHVHTQQAPAVIHGPGSSGSKHI